MSEQELNSYRFLSGQEPTDEMLHAIMTDACKSAIQKAKLAQRKFESEYDRLYEQALKKWSERISIVYNGNIQP